jgi:hypothetical protein
MNTIKLHARADADGIVHLDVPVAEPNTEVDLEIAVRPARVTLHRQPPYSWDVPFFERVLGDRVHRRRMIDMLRQAEHH